MKDSIHKKLTEHIRKTVGRHEVSYEPGSWEEFQRLRNRRRQRQPFVWFRYAMAACLLLGMLGVPLWLYVKPSDSPEQSVRRPQPVNPNDQPEVAQQRSANPVLDQAAGATKPVNQPSLSRNKDLPQDRIAWRNALPRQKEGYESRSDTERQITLEARRNRQKELRQPILTQSTERLPDNKNTASRSEETVKLAGPPGSLALIKPRAQPAYRWSLRPLGLPLSMEPTEPLTAQADRSKTGRNPVWSVGLAPQSVYAAGSSAKATVGGGLFSEIPLSKRFSLSTGLSMARQTLGTAESGPLITWLSPHLVSTDIRLTTLDVPLNVRFRPKRLSRTGMYVEAGLSSLAFLNERYAETYEQQREVTVLVMGSDGQEQAVTQYVTEQQTVTHSEPAFQRIYWGRLVNVSIGVERRLGKQFRLSAEPYLKYPIGPFTRENLMLGSGGVSLRLGFRAGR
ncbi:outer membrane protein with beta-barrel domain [Larkinella arboricola]|uniref:Outer membrane protein with beta-barrel domain n=1 Tax=Larkinella arboricola TaxID=643671 RepID=A0A327XDC6_LARAB|nr:outer membrane beta-barrel protein [Larkinella arboricola]RAK02266.1 outer membrane protein with beta-barrel domain [Larkinella arboricola]